MAIRTLSIDLETFSDVDLKKCGVYKYAESPNFEILLFGVSVDGGEVIVYDLASGDTVPEEIIKALSDDGVTKWAYNASFERICLSVWLRRNYPQHFRSYSIDKDTVGSYLDPSSSNAAWVYPWMPSVSRWEGRCRGSADSISGRTATKPCFIRKTEKGRCLS